MQTRSIINSEVKTNAVPAMLIGFGAEISGKLDRIDTVAQALEPEGGNLRQERTDCVGTRHHSTYSLCNALHDVQALVISQDGTVQLAR